MTKKNKFNSRIGQTVIANCGLKATIINYIKYNDIDIEFETGDIVKHVSYNNFIHGMITPSISYSRLTSYKNKRIGETSVDKDNNTITIVDYRNCCDIDVKTHDGTVIKHTTYKKFKSKAIQIKESNDHLIGMSFKVFGGQKAKIIDIRNKGDVDIQFEDGVIKKHVQLHSLKTGHVQHPNSKRKRYKKISIGDSDIMQNGLYIKCIEHKQLRRDIFEFEDGTIVNKDNRQFKLKNIEHPKFAYCELISTYKENTYLCICKKCKGKHVLRLSEMKDFECTIGR